VARERGRLEYDQVEYGGLPVALSSAPASRYIARRLEPQSAAAGRVSRPLILANVWEV
jgi:hypothetical protein